MTKFIAAGGGDPEQSIAVDEAFVSLLPRKKILLIPQAVAPELWSYEKTYDWVKNRDAFKEIEIEMWKELKSRTLDELKAFDALYIMGGNTFTLLQKLRVSRFIHLLKPFLDQGGILFGLSAGSILMGQSIEIAEIGPVNQADENTIGLMDFQGLNLLNGYILYTHYESEQDEQLFNYTKAHKIAIIAIPEESALFVEGDKVKVVGTEPVVAINETEKIEYAPGKNIISVV